MFVYTWYQDCLSYTFCSAESCIMKNSTNKARLTNWDLLRSLAMFLVVVVHTAQYLGEIYGCQPGYAIGSLVIICDPIFFALSGYFAFRPLKTSLKEYYLNKTITIVFPLVLYSILLYLLTPFNEMSLGGYFKHFSDLLKNGWWFIPTLIPCLIAAPFLYKGFAALTDRGLLNLSRVFAGLCIAGIILMTLRWAFIQAGIETLSYLFDLMYTIVPPSILSTSIVYFQFFCLGGIYKRLSALIPKRVNNLLIIFGLVCWIMDTIWKIIGMPLTDPSYFWVFTTFGVMILFDRLRINSETTIRAITWVAKRSYSIYLLQFMTISKVSGLIYRHSFFGDVAEMADITRLAIWLFVTISSYLLALLIASICDPLLLEKIQGALKRRVIAKG